MARSPSGKAEDCKSSIVGSIPTRASSFTKASGYMTFHKHSGNLNLMLCLYRSLKSVSSACWFSSVLKVVSL